MSFLEMLIGYSRKLVRHALPFFLSAGIFVSPTAAQEIRRCLAWLATHPTPACPTPPWSSETLKPEPRAPPHRCRGPLQRFRASVGRYEIAASKAGFQTDRRSSLNLVVGQRAEVDFKLQIGGTHQTVEVPAVSTTIQITTEDDSGLVGERQVKELPSTDAATISCSP